MDLTDHKSYSGNVLCLNCDLVAWLTHKQLVKATPSAKAGYSAISDACKDRLGLYHFIDEFLHVDLPMHIYMANQGVMCMAATRSKHIDLHYQMIRDFKNTGIIKLSYISE